jgi:CYTH domain-containing protein
MSTQRIGKYACLEIERRYLLRKLPADLKDRPPANVIADLYITNSRLRLRKMQPPTGPAVLKLGQKFRGPDQPATETTITNMVLNDAEYTLLKRLGGREIVKERHLLPHAGRVWGIDVFRGPLEGLILAEVECETREELAMIAKPPFAAADVTDDVFFTGGHLVGASVGDLKRKLASFAS